MMNLSKVSRRLLILSTTLTTGIGVWKGTQLSMVATAQEKKSNFSTTTIPDFVFEAGTAVIPGPGKESKGGEDANYVSKSVLAVFDGVGGWASHGIDPADYPKLVAKNLQEYAENKEDDKKPQYSMRLLKYAANMSTGKVVGSSTACIVTLNANNEFDTANLGDSGFMIIRDKLILHRSEEQQSGFNRPYQIGTGGNRPEQAINKNFAVKDGDLVILGSDGLFDNLYDKDILDIVDKNHETIKANDFVKIAQLLANAAQKYSEKPNYLSPFARHAMEAGYNFVGGKPDDITVIVAKVKAVPKA